MPTEEISIAGLNKADVLAALYNASRPQGMGFMRYDPKPMTREEAEKILADITSFDYLQGRVMKLDLSGDEFNPWGYDRDNGSNAAANAIAALRRSGNSNDEAIQADHRAGVRDGAEGAEDMMRTLTHVEEGEGMPIVNLGMADVAHHVAPKIEAARKANNL